MFEYTVKKVSGRHAASFRDKPLGTGRQCIEGVTAYSA
jgi:hypothetical protein